MHRPANLAFGLVCAFVLILFWAAGAGKAQGAERVPGLNPDDRQICAELIWAAERSLGIPEHLMQAVGMVESGRWDQTQKRTMPFPWIINAAGKDMVFKTKAQAVAAVRRLQRQGIKSIDVGCMQVNLAYHKDAFASLEEAFDPIINVAYAAHFLSVLHEDYGSWTKAVGAYHSLTPAQHFPYRMKVGRAWADMKRAAAEAKRARTLTEQETRRAQRTAEREARQRSAQAERSGA
jgi:hypothetical protein